ncbi:PAS domain S-box protein [Belnapia sp. F-4-1]|uniref:PAS domain S-box protein n=1 Tax=Belnapia sp. F-4-1 TaxID=1545443 RepID=UPI00068A2C5D|nr:PAS domain S-box protein [Belnapia sp. F-4-1]
MDVETWPGFPAVQGEMADRLRAHEWGATPLGPIECWPQSLRTAVDLMLAARHPVYIAWGPELTSLFNDGYIPILGNKHPAALGKPCAELFAEVWHEFQPLVTATMAGEAQHFVDRPVALAGRPGLPMSWFTFSWTPLRDEAGRIAGIYCSATDTTEKVLVEQALRARSERDLRRSQTERERQRRLYEAILTNTPDLAYVFDLDHRFIYANEGLLRMWGRTWDEAIGKTCHELGYPDWHAAMHDREIEQVIATRQPIRGEVPFAGTFGRRIYDYIFVPVIDADGRVEAVAGTTRDVTESRQAEEALRESEARFRVMADAVPQIVWITDAEGRTEFFNRQWSDYTGVRYEPTTAAGVAANFVHPDDAEVTMTRFEEARRTGGSFLVEHRIRSKDGEYRWFLVRGEPHRDSSSGEIVRWFGASVDIHDRREAEAALRESEARWRGLFGRMQEGVEVDELVYDADGRAVDVRYLEVNPAWERQTGLPRETVVGRRMGEIFPAEEVAFWTEAFARVAETGKAADIERYVAPLGRWYEVIAYPFEPGRTAALVLDVTVRKAEEERRALLMREVDHRAKNALAVVGAALRLTRAPDVPTFQRIALGRISALARAQTLLAQDRWRGADLRTLVEGELAPFVGEVGPRVEVNGASVVLPPGAAQPVAMALHELATNAVKYGALSVATGRVSVSWRFDDEALGRLRLRWAEASGPPVDGPPLRRGFGSRVIEDTIRRQLGGEASLTWDAGGVACEITVPLWNAGDGGAAAQYGDGAERESAAGHAGDSLARAEQHVRDAEQGVARQRLIVEGISEHRHPRALAEARRVLAALQQTLQLALHHLRRERQMRGLDPWDGSHGH